MGSYPLEARSMVRRRARSVPAARWCSWAPVGVTEIHAEALGTDRGLRLLGGLWVARASAFIGADDEEVEDEGDDQERDDRVDERAVADFAVVDREGQGREVRLTADGRDERGDDVLDKRVDDLGERGADDNRDRQVEDVAAQDERLELIDQTSPCSPSPRLAAWRPATLPEPSTSCHESVPRGTPKTGGQGWGEVMGVLRRLAPLVQSES